MAIQETGIVNLAGLGNSAKARYLYARQMFQTADQSETPNSQVLIDAHEEWLDQEFRRIGIDATKENLFTIFYNSKVSDKKYKPALNRIEAQSRASTSNILQGLLWYEAPEFASWKQLRMKFIAQDALVGQGEAVAYMLQRQARSGWRIADWNSPESYKSLIYGYDPLKSRGADFTFEVNEHHVGTQGHFDFADSKRRFTGIKAYFDPANRLFEVAFEGYYDFLGWDQVDGEAPIYRLAHVRKLVRDLYARVKSGEQEFIQLAKWKAH